MEVASLNIEFGDTLGRIRTLQERLGGAAAQGGQIRRSGPPK